MDKHCAAGHSVANWKKPDGLINNAILQMNVTYVSIQSRWCRFETSFQKRDTFIYLYKDVFLVLRQNLHFC